MEKIILKRGYNVTSVQVWTEQLSGRPFPAYAVLCDIHDDGTIDDYKGANELRQDIIKNLVSSK